MTGRELKIMSLLRRTAAAVILVAAAAAGESAAAQSLQPATESRIIHIAATPGAMPQHLPLGLNKAAIIELDTDARDVFVGNPAIADAVVRTPRRIFIMALKLGKTNAIFLDSQGKQIATVEIDVDNEVADLNQQLSKQLPGSKVRAEALNDSVVLAGTASSVREAAQAQDLATRFAGAAEKVVNGVKLGQSSQVLIKVRVSEMSRTIAKQFGVNVAAALGKTSDGLPLIVASTDNQFSLLGRALANLSGASVGPACIGGSATCVDKAAATLQALERVGLVHTLAEPNLTAVSGESAKFLAGGEFPVPAGRDRDGNITIIFKQFGVGLAFTPVVLDKGHISLQVSTEVSELTNTGAFILEGGTNAGLTIPALAVRRAETTVELPSGGSMMIGGLLQQQNKQNLDGFPGLKDLPVLGALFRSRDFQNNETELVVTVSAYLVDPINEQRLAGPDDGFVIPTDLETIFWGRLNAVYGKDAKLPPNVPKNAVGYIVQ